jgi:predicted GIY-YIG superfamily endonuclease
VGDKEDQARKALASGIAPRLDGSDLPDHIAAAGGPGKILLAAGPTANQPKRVSDMSSVEKLVEAAFNRSHVGQATLDRLKAAMEPNALAASILTFAGIFVASQFTPIGWAADIGFFFTAVFVGSAVIAAGEHLIQFARAATATTDEQLTDAGREFGAALAEIEVDTLLFFIAKVTGRSGGEPPSNVPPSADAVLATRNGQLVLVTASTIPLSVATHWGILGAGTSSIFMVSSSGGGDKPPDGGGDDEGGSRRKLPAPPRDRVFVRAGLRYRMKGDGPAFDALEKMPAGWAVYKVKNSSGTVIYVGITERGWVRWGEHLAEKEGNFLGDIDTFEFVGAGYGEREALALETDLIKEYDPQWNIDKDPYGKRFPKQQPLEPQHIPKPNMRITFTIENVFEGVR